jgi:NDP-sugar pyrophosphorylase family protein
MEKMIQFVLPAAGAGSRFLNVGIKTPKPLIPILGIPMICWVLANLNIQKCDTVYILKQSSHDYNFVLDYWLKKFKSQIQFINVDNLTDGPAITASLASSLLSLNERLVIANSDQFVSQGMSEFNTLVRKSNDSNHIMTMDAESNKWSYVKRNSEGFISEVKEKEEISNEATVGIYSWCRAELFFESLSQMIAANDRVNNEYYVAPTYNYLINQNLSVEGYNVGKIGETIFGLGTPEDLAKFEGNNSIEKFRENVYSFLSTIN